MIKYIFGFFNILGLGELLLWLYNLYDEIKHDIDTVVNYASKTKYTIF
jgi:penicillin-binding protein 1A